MPINWINYFFHTDFSEHAETLAQLPVDVELQHDQRLVLASILTDADKGVGKDLWRAEGSEKEWNLSLATVFYNDRNSNRFATNSKYSHVLILAFGSESEGPTGKLYLQYNREVV